MAYINGLNTLFGILVFLLPGFIAVKVEDILVNNPKNKEVFEKVIDSLIYSLLLYAVAKYMNLEYIPEISENKDTGTMSLVVDQGKLIRIMLLSFWFGFFHSYIINFNVFMTIFRMLKATSNSGRDASVWHDSFSRNKDCFVRIHLDNGTKISGHPGLYSTDQNEREIFVEDAEIKIKDQKAREVPGVLLSVKDIKMIEFLKGEKKDASDQKTKVITKEETTPHNQGKN